MRPHVILDCTTRSWKISEVVPQSQSSLQIFHDLDLLQKVGWKRGFFRKVGLDPVLCYERFWLVSPKQLPKGANLDEANVSAWCTLIRRNFQLQTGICTDISRYFHTHVVDVSTFIHVCFSKTFEERINTNAMSTFASLIFSLVNADRSSASDFWCSTNVSMGYQAGNIIICLSMSGTGLDYLDYSKF